MAVPKFYEFFRAFLVVLQDGELHKMSEVRNRIAADMNGISQYMNPYVPGHYSAEGLELLGKIAGEALGKMVAESGC